MDDPADLDGDRKFDCIDISILEDDRRAQLASNNRGSGCCVMIFIFGTAIGSGWWGTSHYLKI